MPRFARICYNTNSWDKPSNQVKGKENSFPGRQGFGFDEWLLDTRKLSFPISLSSLYYDDASYKKITQKTDLVAGFIQAYKHLPAGQIHDLFLFSINSGSFNIELEIKDCMRLSDYDANQIKNIHYNHYYTNDMSNDLSGLSLSIGSPSNSIDVFNVAFSISNATLVKSKTPYGKTKNNRYSRLYY